MNWSGRNGQGCARMILKRRTLSAYIPSLSRWRGIFSTVRGSAMAGLARRRFTCFTRNKRFSSDWPRTGVSTRLNLCGLKPQLDELLASKYRGSTQWTTAEDLLICVAMCWWGDVHSLPYGDVGGDLVLLPRRRRPDRSSLVGPVDPHNRLVRNLRRRDDAVAAQTLKRLAITVPSRMDAELPIFCRGSASGEQEL